MEIFIFGALETNARSRRYLVTQAFMNFLLFTTTTTILTFTFQILGLECIWFPTTNISSVCKST